MNVLFLSLGEFDDLSTGSVHIDILKEFAKKHEVYLVCKRERRYKKKTELSKEYGINVLRVKTGNIKKTNLLEKGISTILLEYHFLRAIKKYLNDVKIDLILYTTPPITLVKTIKYVKKKCGAKTYLMLKDIFPQNAVDIGIMSKNGPKGVLYRFFRKKEKKLYEISDKIGCMSPANCQYVLENNSEIDSAKVEICPNAVNIVDMRISGKEREQIRGKYGIPLDKKVFVYGGNLGRPQGIPFLLDCLKTQLENTNAYFLIVGDGTEYSRLDTWFNDVHPINMKLMKRLPKEDYDKLVAGCDVGMIFLDHRFTIPNFPSRILSYMQAGLPILACTDPNTDVGQIAVDGGFGWWCESNDTETFVQKVDEVLVSDCIKMGQNAFEYLEEHYSVEKAYQALIVS